MFCAKCGAECSDGDVFCGKCGSKRNDTLTNPEQGYGESPQSYEPETRQPEGRLVGNKMRAPGRVFLLIAGIAYIIFGAFYVATGLFLEGLGQVLEVGDEIGHYTFAIVLLAGYNFVIGVVGIAHRGNPSKGGLLMALVVIDVVLGIVIGLALGTFYEMTPAMWLLYAIPLFYFIGAWRNKNAAA